MRDRTVLVLALDFPPSIGGIQEYLAGAVSALGPSTVVLAPEPPFPWRHDLGPDVRVERVPRCPRPLRPLAWLAAVRRLMGQSAFCSVAAGHVRLGPLAWAIRRLTGLPFAVLAYGMEVTSGGHGALKRRIWRAADRIVAISEFTRRKVVEAGAAPSRTQILHPGLREPTRWLTGDPDRARRRLGFSGGPVLVTVARLDKRERYKGHDLVLECLPGVLSRFPSLVWAVMGDGSDRMRLEIRARDLGLKERALFVGEIPPDERPDWYALADVFVMPGREVKDRDGLKFEGFGIVFLEAAAAGRPVIAGRAGGAPDAVAHGVTGLLVDPTDPRDLSLALLRLLSDPEEARAMGRAGRERVEREFVWEKLPVRERLLFDPGGGAAGGGSGGEALPPPRRHEGAGGGRGGEAPEGVRPARCRADRRRRRFQ
ncbi:MAG: glycosyltransferase family 4 protein [Planctomycetes bacterium]|nr:glycosyltransferase family 4 protein [Planctomycetota bacterium]